MIVYMVYDDTVEPSDFDSIEIFQDEQKALKRLFEMRFFCQLRSIKENFKIMEKELR